MKQIRIHGRGGQGVVTAAELLAKAAFFDGLYAQAFPFFGVERSGAPIQSFVRIDKQPIITREQIYSPDVLIIQDDNLIKEKEIFSGIHSKTILIINSYKTEKELALKLKNKNIYTLPATEIALKILGENLVNTIMLGYFIKITQLISIKSIMKVIEDKFKDKEQKIIEQNKKAILQAYQYEAKK